MQGALSQVLTPIEDVTCGRYPITGSILYWMCPLDGVPSRCMEDVY
jgi:hypothetical protein